MDSTSSMESTITENSEDIGKNMLNKIRNSDWKEVVNIYGKYPRAHKIKITVSGQTALHLAIRDPDEFEGKYEVVKELLQHIKRDSDPFDVLRMENEKGRTPLHAAATFDREGKMCKICIDSVGDMEKASQLVRVTDKKGQTPLFMAVHHGRLETFLYLHSILGDTGGDFSFCVRDDDRSILHDAIIKENFDLAFQIIHLYKDLVNHVDKQGDSPLHALSRKAAAFPSGSTLRRESRIIYDCISVEKLEVKNEAGSNYEEKKNVELANRRGYVKKERTDNDIESGEGDTAIRKICVEKEKHVWADQVLNELLEHATMDDKKGGVKYRDRRPGQRQQGGISDDGSQEDSAGDSDELVEDNISPNRRTTLSSSSEPGKDESSKRETQDTALLIAAKYGIVEMVKKIIDKFPEAIYDVDQERKNILLVAVENRHLKMFKLLSKKYPRDMIIFQKMDKNGNTALHFAATYVEGVRSWPVPGAALQMQWEIKWLKFMEKTMPPRLFLRTNAEGQTPREIFSNTHKPLIKAGGEWLMGMATSCSVVAALIITIAYASSTTVPGGTDSDSGKPKLREIPTFELFAIASLAALCFSVTSLVTFLAILTARHEEKDFDKRLPRKILLGLTSLFVSIAAMLVTFSAGHFLVFEEKFNYAAFPVYAVTFLPLCLFAAAQFPLYIDIFRASFWNPF